MMVMTGDEKEERMYGWRGKIGLLVPSTNIPAEMDAHRLVPEGVAVTTRRVRFAGEVTVETVRAHLDYVEDAADLLASAGVDVMVYGIVSSRGRRGIASWPRRYTGAQVSHLSRPPRRWSQRFAALACAGSCVSRLIPANSIPC